MGNKKSIRNFEMYSIPKESFFIRNSSMDKMKCTKGEPMQSILQKYLPIRRNSIVTRRILAKSDSPEHIRRLFF